MTDVLLVGLGATPGLRAAEDELVASLRRAGAEVALERARRPREVRTFALTDLGWARAARRAAQLGIARHRPEAVVYSTTTAALLWPRRGAIRFDALAAETRPGRHGAWQRPVERRRLAQAPVLVPQAHGVLGPVPPAPVVVVPVPVEPSGSVDGPRDLAAVTYATHWRKKGLDRVLAAWRALGAGEGTVLVVAGEEPGRVLEAWTAGGGTGGLPASVRVVGSVAPAEFRALLRRSRAFVTAPRREDHGIAQLEALADGCALVTTAAPGPYAALALARALDPRWVAPDGDDPDALAAALRAGLEAGGAAAGPGRTRVLELLAPHRRAAADRAVADELLPLLLPR